MPDLAPPSRPQLRKVPSQARSRETLRVIVEAAARILETAGLEGFSTNAVAERAGVSVGSLYQYLSSKDALMGALIARETSQLIDEAEASIVESSGTRALAVLVAACIRHQFRRPALARLLDFEEARLPLDPELRETARRFSAIVEAAVRRPDLPCQPDPQIAAGDVMSIIKGMVDAAGMRQESDQDALARRVNRAVRGYIMSTAT